MHTNSMFAMAMTSSAPSEADGYSRFMGELHRIQGELWEKVAELDPCKDLFYYLHGLGHSLIV